MRNNNKAVSDEEIIACLMQYPTMREAAGAAGISPRTLYDRMDSKDFKVAYMQAKNEVIRAAVFKINSKVSTALDTIAEIMEDEENDPNTRLKAATTILSIAEKFTHRLRTEEAQTEAVAHPFSFDFEL